MENISGIEKILFLENHIISGTQIAYSRQRKRDEQVYNKTKMYKLCKGKQKFLS